MYREQYVFKLFQQEKDFLKNFYEFNKTSGVKKAAGKLKAVSGLKDTKDGKQNAKLLKMASLLCMLYIHRNIAYK